MLNCQRALWNTLHSLPPRLPRWGPLGGIQHQHGGAESGNGPMGAPASRLRLYVKGNLFFQPKKVPEMASTESIQKFSSLWPWVYHGLPTFTPKTIHWTPAQPDLVGGFNPLWKNSQLGWWFRINGKCSKPPTSLISPSWPWLLGCFFIIQE